MYPTATSAVNTTAIATSGGSAAALRARHIVRRAY
jgi:hypothetical protein